MASTSSISSLTSDMFSSDSTVEKLFDKLVSGGLRPARFKKCCAALVGIFAAPTDSPASKHLQNASSGPIAATTGSIITNSGSDVVAQHRGSTGTTASSCSPGGRTVAQQFLFLVATNEQRWAEMMQWLCSDANNICAEFVELLSIVTNFEDARSVDGRRVLLKVKLASLLTLNRNYTCELAKIAHKLIVDADDVTLFISKQGGAAAMFIALEAATASCGRGGGGDEAVLAILRLVGSILGRSPRTVVDCLRAGIDGLVCKIGVTMLQNASLSDSQERIVRGVLYTLRFFIRERAETLAFVECVFSIIAYAIRHPALRGDCDELCGDLCCVVQPAAAKVYAQKPNVLWNVIALLPQMGAQRRRDAVVLMWALVSHIPQTEVAEEQKKKLMYAYKAMMSCFAEKLPETLEEAVLFLHVAVGLIVFAKGRVFDPIPQFMGITSFQPVGKSKALLEQAPAQSAVTTGGWMLLLRLLHMFVAPPISSVPVALGMCWVPLQTIVEKRLMIGKEKFKQATGQKYNREEIEKLDSRVESMITAMQHYLNKLSTEEEDRRAALVAERNNEFDNIAASGVAARQEIENSVEELRFRQTDFVIMNQLKKDLNKYRHIEATYRQRSVEECKEFRAYVEASKKQQLRTLRRQYDKLFNTRSLTTLEAQQARTRYIIECDMVKANANKEIDTRLRAMEWRQRQGNLFNVQRCKYFDFMQSPKEHSKLCLDMCEQLERGFGWYRLEEADRTRHDTALYSFSVSLSSLTGEELTDVATEEAMERRKIVRRFLKLFGPAAALSDQLRRDAIETEQQEAKLRIRMVEEAARAWIMISEEQAADLFCINLEAEVEVISVSESLFNCIGSDSGPLSPVLSFRTMDGSVKSTEEITIFDFFNSRERSKRNRLKEEAISGLKLLHSLATLIREEESSRQFVDGIAGKELVKLMSSAEHAARVVIILQAIQLRERWEFEIIEIEARDEIAALQMRFYDSLRLLLAGTVEHPEIVEPLTAAGLLATATVVRISTAQDV